MKGERNGRLERDGVGWGTPFRGSRGIQGECRFLAWALGWMVGNREGGRTGRAGQEFHMQDEQQLAIPGLVHALHFTDGESEASGSTVVPPSITHHP